MTGAAGTAPLIQGWCPGALRPMLSGDGFVVRVRPVGGRLTPDQARGLARLSGRYGNGLIDLSSRANVQLRGVSAEAHPALIEGLRGLGLVDPTPEAEAMRNIPVTPFWRAGDPAQAIAAALARALAAPDAPLLPGKFGYAIDTGPRPVMRGMSCDIRVERAADGGLIVVPDGAASGAPCALEDAAATVMALARWFAESGGIHENRGRMARHLARGAELPAAFCAIPAQAVPPGDPRPGLCEQGALVGFDFGQMQAATLAALAGLGPLRTTPWRMVLVEGLHVMPDMPGVITRADDPMLNVVACTGAPACLQAQGATRDLARRLAPHARGLLHVSGCAKGCAHPGPAATVLVAGAGGLTLARNATAADPGLPVAASDLPRLLQETP